VVFIEINGDAKHKDSAGGADLCFNDEGHSNIKTPPEVRIYGYHRRMSVLDIEALPEARRDV
jgi:hypothetical protein